MDPYMVVWYSLCMSTRRLRTLLNNNVGTCRISPSFLCRQAGRWSNDDYFERLFQASEATQTSLRHFVGPECFYITSQGYISAPVRDTNQPAQVSSNDGADYHDLSYQGFHVFERTLSRVQRTLLRRRIHQYRLGLDLD